MGYGITMSVDEQKCPIQGKSQYKTCYGEYKRNGEGIQTDAIADDGYTVDFYFQNEPVAKKWIRLGLYLMFVILCKCLKFFSNPNHCIIMDNLFNLITIIIAAASCTTKVRSQGISLKPNHGASPCVCQVEVSSKTAERAHGYGMVDVLMGDPWVNDVVIASLLIKNCST